jgi:putative transposase
MVEEVRLKKLGHKACPSYVRDVLRRYGLAPAPNRRGLSWKQFLQSHLGVSWAADFLTEEVWTLGGLVTFYVLFFLHLGSRRVWIAGCTPQPHGSWMAQQARNFSMVVEDWELPCRYLVHDRDTSFAAMDRVLKTNDLRILKTPPHSPLCNAYAERHVRELHETLDNLILLGVSPTCAARSQRSRAITTPGARTKESAMSFRWALTTLPSQRFLRRSSASRHRAAS